MRRPTVTDRRNRGISAPELAVSATVLVSCVLGIIEFSRLGMMTQLLTNAAREGCRTAAISNSALSDVQIRINRPLYGSGVSVSNLTAVDNDPGTAGAYIMPANWDTAPGDTPITVIVRMKYSQLSWTSPFFLKNANVVGLATMNSERP